MEEDKSQGKVASVPEGVSCKAPFYAYAPSIRHYRLVIEIADGANLPKEWDDLIKNLAKEGFSLNAKEEELFKKLLEGAPTYNINRPIEVKPYLENCSVTIRYLAPKNNLLHETKLSLTENGKASADEIERQRKKDIEVALTECYINSCPKVPLTKFFASHDILKNKYLTTKKTPNCSGINLARLQLNGSIFSYSCFKDVNFTGASLKKVELSETELDGAIFVDVIDLKPKQLAKAIFDTLICINNMNPESNSKNDKRIKKIIDIAYNMREKETIELLKKYLNIFQKHGFNSERFELNASYSDKAIVNGILAKEGVRRRIEELVEIPKKNLAIS